MGDGIQTFDGDGVIVRERNSAPSRFAPVPEIVWIDVTLSLLAAIPAVLVLLLLLSKSKTRSAARRRNS